MPHLRLASVLVTIFSVIVVTLVNFAFKGSFGISDLITSSLVGLFIGGGAYLAYRHHAVENCQK